MYQYTQHGSWLLWNHGGHWGECGDVANRRITCAWATGSRMDAGRHGPEACLQHLGRDHADTTDGSHGHLAAATGGSVPIGEFHLVIPESWPLSDGCGCKFQVTPFYNWGDERRVYLVKYLILQLGNSGPYCRYCTVHSPPKKSRRPTHRRRRSHFPVLHWQNKMYSIKMSWPVNQPPLGHAPREIARLMIRA